MALPVASNVFSMLHQACQRCVGCILWPEGPLLASSKIASQPSSGCACLWRGRMGAPQIYLLRGVLIQHCLPALYPLIHPEADSDSDWPKVTHELHHGCVLQKLICTHLLLIYALLIMLH